MKKISFVAMILMFLAFAGTAWATTFTFGDSDLLALKKTYDNPPGNATLNIVGPVAGGVGYDISLSGTQDTFSQIQIGYDKMPAVGGTLPSQYFDLSAYNTFELAITNTSNTNDWFMANLYINTGWTDAPWIHEDDYAENTWTWVAPGDTVNLLLDLTNLGVITGTGSTGIGDDRRKWVSGIGFNIGTNIGEGNYFGDHISMAAAPVPEPATMLLLGSGLIGLAAAGRRKFFKK